MNCKMYHGCLNTFSIIEDELGLDYNALAIDLCKQNETDGFIVVRKSPLEMMFFNADGSRGPMCGNGIRCFARYCYDSGITLSKTFDVLTLAGVLRVQITSLEPFLVKVKMGKANLESEKCFIDTKHKTFLDQELLINGEKIIVSTFFMNTIHTVTFVENFSEIEKFGEALCNHSIYKQKTNVNFVKIVDRKNVEVRTFERGVGWTLACGTGASSAFVLGRLKSLLDSKVKVTFLGGEIYLSMNEEDEVYMEGPAEELKRRR